MTPALRTHTMVAGLCAALAGCGGPIAAARAPAEAVSVPPLHAAATEAAARDREAFVREMHARFSDSEFLIGIGGSKDTAEQAEAHAATDVAASIRSHVEYSFRTVEAGVFHNGSGQVDTRVFDEVLQKVESDAGAFLRPRREHTKHSAAGWLAVVVASRADLDAKYAEDARPLLDRLRQAYDQVLSAPRWIVAAPAWCELLSIENEVDRRSMERWAVSRRSLWPAHLLERRDRAHVQQREAKASLKVTVMRLGEAAEADPADAIVSGLRASGWAASATSTPSCLAGGLILQPTLGRDCRRSSLGIESCKVSLGVEGRACDHPAALFALSREAQATDSRDPERAERSARKKLEVARVAQEAVGRALSILGECQP